MITKLKNLSWKPVRRGHIYCAPACGYDCTHVQYLAAIANSNRLAQICGPGFKGEVWENLGWHYKATSKRVDVREHKSGSGFYWSAQVKGFHSWADSRTNPKRAIFNAIQSVKAEIRELQNLIEGA